MKHLGMMATALAVVALAMQPPVRAQQAGLQRIAANTTTELRSWDAYIAQRQRSGDLRMQRVDRDPAIPGRTVERLQQYHDGVPIWGAEAVRDSEQGIAQSIFGTLAPDLSLSTDARLSGDAVGDVVRTMGGPAGTVIRQPELMIVPLDSGRYRLAYRATIARGVDVFTAFVDANSGAELLRYSEIETQSAVGTGRGVLGDTKKLSVLQQAGAFTTDDRLRPPVLDTYDLRGNLGKLVSFDSGAPLTPSDLGTDTDNNWTDPAVVDAHVHVGWTYDYYYKRFGRRGLDNRDRPITIMVNALTQQAGLTVPADLVGRWVIQASWCDVCGPGGAGRIFFGSGIPAGFYLIATGNNYTYFSGALDIAAHELTHGVTSSTSRLIYLNESGALNESFSDVMGTSVEFFFQPPGNGPGKADYLIGEDISRAVAPGARDGDRSLENPALYGQPDHYSRRYLGQSDNGGVHINSGIGNHAFYLAIEGGTNRTSGLSVQGVGPANRDQIEKVFYRAFTLLLPDSANYSLARAATIQAARDLYGAGSAAERAVTQAWTAVGVQ
jgi:thermolysin